jgi:FKBP-type peptidyl-prolyl cis-trans isomerase SlyD
MSRALAVVLALVVLTLPAAAQDKPAAPAVAPPPLIEAGSTVDLEYTLKDAIGVVLDSTRGRTPLRYVHGRQQLMPALEKALSGLHAGDEKRLVVEPEDAYGRVNPNAEAEVPKETLPEGALVVGTRLMARAANGETRPVMVKEVKGTTVLLDLNHPLAGKTLVFDLKVLGVEPPASPAARPDAPAPTEKRAP